MDLVVLPSRSCTARRPTFCLDDHSSALSCLARLSMTKRRSSSASCATSTKNSRPTSPSPVMSSCQTSPRCITRTRAGHGCAYNPLARSLKLRLGSSLALPAIKEDALKLLSNACSPSSYGKGKKTEYDEKN